MLGTFETDLPNLFSSFCLVPLVIKNKVISRAVELLKQQRIAYYLHVTVLHRRRCTAVD